MWVLAWLFGWVFWGYSGLLVDWGFCSGFFVGVSGLFDFFCWFWSFLGGFLGFLFIWVFGGVFFVVAALFCFVCFFNCQFAF